MRNVSSVSQSKLSRNVISIPIHPSEAKQSCIGKRDACVRLLAFFFLLSEPTLDATSHGQLSLVDASFQPRRRRQRVHATSFGLNVFAALPINRDLRCLVSSEMRHSIYYTSMLLFFFPRFSYSQCGRWGELLRHEGRDISAGNRKCLWWSIVKH